MSGKSDVGPVRRQASCIDFSFHGNGGWVKNMAWRILWKITSLKKFLRFSHRILSKTMKKYHYLGPFFNLWKGSWGPTFKLWESRVPRSRVPGPTFTRCHDLYDSLFGFSMIWLVWTCKLQNLNNFCIKICIMRFLKDKMSSISSHLYEETSKPNKESYWLEVSVTNVSVKCEMSTRHY